MLVPRLSLRGDISKMAAAGVALGFAASTMILYRYLHDSGFLAFWNWGFGAAMLFVGALLVSSRLIRGGEAENVKIPGGIISMAAVILLLAVLTEEIFTYWYYKRWDLPTPERWRVLAHMCISVTWAIYGASLMVVGFARKIPSLRYFALGLFVAVLVKVFVFDMAELDSIYRVAGFIVLGLVLTCVSFLYQYCKKKGFFDAMQSPGKEVESADIE